VQLARSPCSLIRKEGVPIQRQACAKLDRRSRCDPHVWSGALQESFADLAVSGLASMYPTFDWSVAPGHETVSACLALRVFLEARGGTNWNGMAIGPADETLYVTIGNPLTTLFCASPRLLESGGSRSLLATAFSERASARARA
jgi:hypothetical protein